MGLIERLEAKRRELDQAVICSLGGVYDYRTAEMRDLLDEVSALMVKPPLILPADAKFLEQYVNFETGGGYLVYGRD